MCWSQDSDNHCLQLLMLLTETAEKASLTTSYINILYNPTQHEMHEEQLHVYIYRFVYYTYSLILVILS